MKINTIKIKNFRGIPDMEISLERISFFTGPCGAGKTSVLKAFNFYIELFYSIIFLKSIHKYF